MASNVMPARTFRLPENLLSQIEVEAQAHGMLVPDFVRGILERGLRIQSIERQLWQLNELLKKVQLTAGVSAEPPAPPAIDPARLDALESWLEDAVRAATRAWTAVLGLVEMREGVDWMRHLREQSLKRADAVIENIKERHKTLAALPKLEVL